MKRPSLRVSRWMGDIPVEGECTSCAGVRFNVRPISHRPNREEYQNSLQGAFGAHLKNVHVREDSNEGALRIAKEATEPAKDCRRPHLTRSHGSRALIDDTKAAR